LPKIARKVMKPHWRCAFPTSAFNASTVEQLRCAAVSHMAPPPLMRFPQ
jgi:hypothetical protein